MRASSVENNAKNKLKITRIIMSTQFDHASIVKKSNIFFDGKCISHTVILADGSKKSVGVILPSTLVFNTGVPEIMEITAGKCRARIKGEADWKTYEGGQSFSVPGNSSFEIDVAEPVDYVCHFG
jgi:uncharacterized protein YaiE (UPF0345 family)